MIVDATHFYTVSDTYHMCCGEVMFRYNCKSCGEFMGCYFCEFDYTEKHACGE